MATTYGLCPTCRREKRLTESLLVVPHITRKEKCPGSGGTPTAITRTANVAMPKEGLPQSGSPPAASEVQSREVAPRTHFGELGAEFGRGLIIVPIAFVACLIAFFYGHWGWGTLFLLVALSIGAALWHSAEGQRMLKGPQQHWRASQSRRTSKWTSRIAIGFVAGILIVGLIAANVARRIDNDNREDLRQAQVAACDALHEAAMEHLGTSGAGAGGRAWAKERLANWPDAAALGDCYYTRTFVQEIADGVVDRRIAEAAKPPETGSGTLTCEQRLAAMMDLDIDIQSRRDNVDSIRIDCNLPPLQQDPFWQEAWQRHLQESEGG